ncbi:hypothetical protein ESA94_13215 [Lacibacter luteus]|uniref:DUF4468 domain-containing protein n=1 Tax=Lacibacter luteus TaxID=2508719 RepID=A0A4Q1CIL0_9BACT|nr:hypothetical protein [Lacibacter luteus]RXK60001.1 hypothetical protein ESA94_13215 [Lacibacter luteus]
MKKLVFLFLIGFLFTFSAAAQEVDAAMKSRLDTFLKLNQALDFEKLMDYIYPKVFTVAPREQLIEIFKSTFAGDDEVKMEMDSLQYGSISPLVVVNKGSYHLIRYSMLIRMQIKQEASDAADGNTTMLNVLKSQYGAKNVRYDAASKKFVVNVNTNMVAVKDETSPEWTFLNFEPDHPLAAQLLDAAVISKLKTFRKEQKN